MDREAPLRIEPELRNLHETFNNFALEIDERAMRIIEGTLLQDKI